ncbi:S41 family peptidase [Luteibacter yeojuensis]|uniref:Tricorn protease homolog n=1 Tax=Luteibacter yeojuensis TaxID=345309 RepID=A0A0F3KWQ0_9GAMM|nr:S41 family peptidase [Luteibacter yeojuensis]KJV35695.1 hypothetical protein VI08_06735 [Luteibacter yeojuensis]
MTTRHWLCMLAAFAASCVAHASPALIRYPNVHGGKVVFVARDALWVASTQGGKAQALADMPGPPSAPRFSPDGRYIAFTAQNRGNEDVYVVSSAGGPTTRLTWAADTTATPPPWWGPNNLVVGWAPDSSAILFLSRSTAFARSEPVLMKVPVGGGLPVRVDLNDAAMLSYSPDGQAIAYSRTFAAYRPWKRYDGGLAPDVYVYRFASGQRRQLTDWKGTDDFPMWVGQRIFFVSDRDAGRRANLWVMDEDGGNARELTHFTDGDIDFPSVGDGTIAFQQGGALWLMDTATLALHAVPIGVPDDGKSSTPISIALGPYVRPADVTGAADYALSPDGRRVAFSALGRMAWVDVDGKPALPTRRADSDRADEDHPAWSPDGTALAFVTDRSGEEEVVVRAWATGNERVLTHTASGYYYRPTWSPDGKRLLVADAGHGLWLLDAGGGASLCVARDPAAEIRDAAFSADGMLVAYSTLPANQQRALHVYDTRTHADHVVSSPMDSDWSGRFSSDGTRLYFLSNRHAQPVLSDRETDMVPIRSTGVYEAPIKGGVVQMDKATPLPFPGGAYALEGEHGGALFVFAKATTQIESNVEGERNVLHVFDLATRQDRTLAEGAETVDVAPDGRHIAWFAAGTYHVSGTGEASGWTVDLATLRGDVTWQHAWKEMFDKAWRLERDMFEDKALDGAPWRRVHDVLAMRLPALSSQADFHYLLGQLQGEVGSSHTYYGARPAQAPREAEPLLGADLALDGSTGLYRIARILQGDNSRPAIRSPLQAPGIDATAGDYVLAINHQPLKAPRNPQELLAGATGPVVLSLAPSPASAPVDVTVVPLESEAALRQYDALVSRRHLVDSLSHGTIAYIYLTNMAEAGTRQFIDQFYAQQDKKALLVDVRWNTGGFTSQLMLERLRRRPAGVFVNRQGAQATLPDGLLAGPKLVLVNHYSASDGDQFPYFFREEGVGNVVGTRTWGGVRGILGAWPLMDRTTVNVPKDVLLSNDHRPLIENEGVHPDIEVDDDATGDRDAQLERAVQALLNEPGSPQAHAKGSPPR